MPAAIAASQAIQSAGEWRCDDGDARPGDRHGRSGARLGPARGRTRARAGEPRGWRDPGRRRRGLPRRDPAHGVRRRHRAAPRGGLLTTRARPARWSAPARVSRPRIAAAPSRFATPSTAARATRAWNPSARRDIVRSRAAEQVDVRRPGVAGQVEGEGYLHRAALVVVADGGALDLLRFGPRSQRQHRRAARPARPTRRDLRRLGAVCDRRAARRARDVDLLVARINDEGAAAPRTVPGTLLVRGSSVRDVAP